MHHPEFFFHRGFENALINPQNLYILKPHLLCASWEMPLSDSEENFFGSNFALAREELGKEGRLKNRRGQWYLMPSTCYPAEEVNIRSTSSGYYAVVDRSSGDRLLETVESTVALSQIHPGAIYLHQGDSYLVIELDLAGRTAYVMPTTLPYYTQAKEITDLRVLTTTREKEEVKTYLGEVEVTSTVVGFKKKMQFTEEVIGEEVLDLPPQSFNTVALWFDIPHEAVHQIASRGLDFAGGLHAVEHASIAMLPLFALCDRNDIGGVSTPFHPDTGKAQVFIYDAHPGGIGIAEKGFELIQHLWQATLKAIKECPCEVGCPSCIQSPKCGNNNEPLDKWAAVIILGELVGQ
jgi:DEAD/DEAH box helicase domain-containing protein